MDVGCEDGVVFGAELLQCGRVLGQKIVHVADGAAGCIMAGEEKCTDLAYCVGPEGFIESRGGFLRASLLQVTLQNETDDRFTLKGILVGNVGAVIVVSFIKFFANVGLHLPRVIPLYHRANGIQHLQRIDL